MWTKGKFPIVTATLAVGFILLATLAALQQRQVEKHSHQIVAAFYVDICGQTALFAVSGAGVISPIDSPPADLVQNIGDSVMKIGKDHAFQIQACPDATPQQQTYLHR